MNYAINYLREGISTKEVILKMNPPKEKAAALLGEIHSLKLALNKIETIEEKPKGLPRTLTAENGAKALLNGEFFESIETMDEDGNEIGIETAVQWDTIKEIYAKIVDHFEQQGNSYQTFNSTSKQ